VTIAASAAPRRTWVPRFRRQLALLGVLVWLACLVPPMTSWSHRYEFVQAIQFAIFGFWVPPLVAAGAPWLRWRVARIGASGELVGLLHERRRVSQGRVLSFTALFLVTSILWRLAPMVNALTEHEWVVVLEALTLSGTGVALMCDLIESPPLHPGVSRPYRIGISAAVMWSAWVFAYLEAMSHVSWYRAFQHVAGRSVSVSADQQLSAASVWFMTAVVFVPIIFWNLVHWLQSEEDPDDELYQLVREEKTRGFFGYRSD
jgi:cytochrome c oxidase assembly factor CtaG